MVNSSKAATANGPQEPGRATTFDIQTRKGVDLIVFGGRWQTKDRNIQEKCEAPSYKLGVASWIARLIWVNRS